MSTPGDLLFLMVTQLTPHVRAAAIAGRAILGGDYGPQTASAFLYSAAITGDFFWPSKQRKKSLAAAFPTRAEDMRHLVGLPDEEPSDLDLIRNDLTHVDERLEELFLRAPEAQLIAWGDGSGAAEGTRRYMNFDATTGVLHSLGRDVNVPEVVVWLEDLLARLGKVTLPLMLRAPTLGEQVQLASEDK